MFRVLSFSLNVGMSLSMEGVGRMPRRCAATDLVLLTTDNAESPYH